VVAVGEGGGDLEPAATADLHTLHTVIPAGDDLAHAELEAQRLAAVPGGVELLAGGVGDAHVVHVDDVAAAGLLSVADDLVGADQLGGRGALGVLDLGLAAIVHAGSSSGVVRWNRCGRSVPRCEEPGRRSGTGTGLTPPQARRRGCRRRTPAS